MLPTATTESSSTPVTRHACASCQQRKVKCDRLFPCGNCIRRKEKCLSGIAVLPKQRKRRFAERELLDRLRHYEALLKENNISFDPIHKQNTDKRTPGGSLSPPSDVSQGADHDDTGLYVVISRPDFAMKSYWNTINDKRYLGSDDDSDDSAPSVPLEKQIREIWKDVHQQKGYLLPFGQPSVPIDLSSGHPDQITIFKLWQTYLDNVNPLLKVTHTPTLQPRIISAGSNVATISPALNALMFGIYCISILSMSDEECITTFNTPKQDVLINYQLCCQQALSNCGILCTTDREALTALYLYLLSIGPHMDPQSIVSLLGIAIRIAQRMHLDTEASYTDLPALEAELRRRLWWSLILFDSRMGELGGNAPSLLPIWNCRIPLNVNDFELQCDMQASPQASNMSEAVFTVARSDLADLMRHSDFYLDFVNPALKPLGRRHRRLTAPKGSEAATFGADIEQSYLQYANGENSIHFMTVWFTRMLVAKSCLMEHYSEIAHATTPPTEEQREAATLHALEILRCDTLLMSNPLSKGYKWYLYLYIPMPAYFQLMMDLRKRPDSHLRDRSWQAMSEHWDARALFQEKDHIKMFKLFSRIALAAWQACDEAVSLEGRSMPVPRVITAIRARIEEIRQSQAPQAEVANLSFNNDWKLPDDDLSWIGQGTPTDETMLNADISSTSLLGMDLSKFDFNNMDWNPLQTRGW